MNHDKATEEFFRLRGWEWKKNYGMNRPYWWWNEKDIRQGETLPKICESMTDWIKYVAEFMEGENLTFECMDGEARWWDNDNEVLLSKEIKDHQILYASVLACNEYLRSKRNDI